MAKTILAVIQTVFPSGHFERNVTCSIVEVTDNFNQLHRVLCRKNTINEEISFNIL